MALTDGEREALLTQVRVLTSSTETKLSKLGLTEARLILIDGKTGHPMTEQDVIAMAERK